MIKVVVLLELDGDEQSHYFQKYLREKLMQGRVISYKKLPDTDDLKERSSTFRKLIKGVKTAQKLRDDYIHEHN